MFSVIIPLYNKSAYIEKAVASVLNQSFPELDLIVVDDGSTDDSINRLNKFSDQRLKVIRQANAGVSCARNNGVRIAKFEYVVFLDGDDWWDSGYLQEMKVLIQEFPEAKLYGSNYYVVKYGAAKKAVIGVPENFKSGYINYFEVYSNTFWMPLTSSSVVISKAAFNETGAFKHSLKFGEDFDLWARVALKYKIAFLNKFLVYYNQDVDVNNRALGGNKLYSKESYYLFNLAYLEPNEIQDQSLKKLLDGLRVRSLLRYYLNGVYKKEVRAMLLKIDFKNQPRSYRLIYNLPLPAIKMYFIILKQASLIKQFLLRSAVKKN